MRMSIAESQKRSAKGFNLKEDDRAWRPSKCFYSVTLCLLYKHPLVADPVIDGVSGCLFPGLAI